MSAKEKTIASPFSFNLLTLILLLVVLIPVVYTVAANLQQAEPAPVITRVTNVAPTEALNPNEAIETALKFTVTNPGFDTYFKLGLAYYNSANYTKSITAFQKALQYNAKSDLTYNNIAAAYGAINKWDEEIDASQKALAINPNFELAKRNLAWATKMKSSK